MLTQETQLNSSNRSVNTSILNLSTEERDLINSIQQFSERQSQLTSLLATEQGSYDEMSNQVQQLQDQMENPVEVVSEQEMVVLKEQLNAIDLQQQEVHRQYEQVHLDQIQTINRINYIRKELVGSHSLSHSLSHYLTIPLTISFLLTHRSTWRGPLPRQK